MKNKKQIEMYQRIEKHGQSIIDTFPNVLIKDPIKLAKALLRLENKAYKLSLDWCNGAIDQATWEIEGNIVLAKLKKLLGNNGAIILHNGDARGYALKLTEEWTRKHNEGASNRIYTDMGGYGIIAPDFSRD